MKHVYWLRFLQLVDLQFTCCVCVISLDHPTGFLGTTPKLWFLPRPIILFAVVNLLNVEVSERVLSCPRDAVLLGFHSSRSKKDPFSLLGFVWNSRAWGEAQCLTPATAPWQTRDQICQVVNYVVPHLLKTSVVSLLCLHKSITTGCMLFQNLRKWRDWMVSGLVSGLVSGRLMIPIYAPTFGCL